MGEEAVKDLVAWFGPVADFQVEGATVPSAREKFFGCHGAHTPPICSEVAWSLRGADGRSLPAMVGQAGLSLDTTGDIFLGAFSAGGRVVRRLLFDERDRARIRAVLLSDATYADWRDASGSIPFVQPELVSFCAEIIAGSGQLFVATASPSPNFRFPTGVEVLRQLRVEVEQATGESFERIDFFGVEPPPEAAYRLGDVILAEYPRYPLGHAHTDIAPQVWQQVLIPWLERRRRVPAPPEPAPRPEPTPAEAPLQSLDAPLLALGVGMLVGYVGLRLLFRWLD